MMHGLQDKFRAFLYKTYSQMKAVGEAFDNLKLDPVTKQALKLAYFIEQVKTGGLLDIKAHEFSWEKLGYKPLEFEGMLMTPDDLGNYNFGVAAKAFGLSLEFSKLGAGMYQIFFQEGQDWSNFRGYFDYKRDTEMIIKGYNRY